MIKILHIIYLILTLYIGFIFFGGLINDTISDTKNYNIVVYGNTVYPNGEVSERLKARLDHSIELYKSSNIDKVLVSGGIGKEGIDEADAMAKYLIAEGLEESIILIDNLGYTTSDTSKNSYELLGNTPVVGVSQWFHIQRVKLSLKNAGFSDVKGSAPKYFVLRDIYSFSRELLGYLKYLFV